MDKGTDITLEDTKIEEPPPTPPPEPPKKQRRGFAAMDPEKVKAIAKKGGVAVHQKGTAHSFTSDEAREAGKKGGLAPHRTRGRQKKPKAPEQAA